MRTIVKPHVLVIVAERASEAEELRAFSTARTNEIFALRGSEGGLSFHALGLREDVTREPINVSSRSRDPAIRLIGNFAPTPFELDGVAYSCVEAFWQSLKFDEPDERARVATMAAPLAKGLGGKVAERAHFFYRGESIRFGRRDHWDLMERACNAKFQQNAAARDALLSTGERPLTHRMRRDSDSIPAAIMCEIWMRVRKRLRDSADCAVVGSPQCAKNSDRQASNVSAK